MVIRRSAVVLLAAALLVALLPVGAAAADTPTEVLSTSVTPVDANLETGFLTLQVDVELSDPEGLPDQLNGQPPFSPALIRAERVVGAPEDMSRRSFIDWYTPTRVSGTALHGLWRAVAEVTAVQVGSFAITGALSVDDLAGNVVFVDVTDGATFRVTAPDLWDITSRSAPVKVVTGDERFVPSAIVTARSSGGPVAARVNTWGFGADFPSPVRRTGSFGTDLPPTGEWTGAPAPVNGDSWSLLAWGGRGTRGWSLEAERSMCAPVKWQANSHYSALSVARGSTLNVTGNAFPAPFLYNTLYPDRAHLYLQRAGAGGSWQTVATAIVRENGRYTLSWTASGAGTAQLRVRLPGALTDCGLDVGTTLASVAVTVR